MSVGSAMSRGSALSRLEGVDRSLPVWLAAAGALVVLMALPLAWLGYMSVSAEGGGSTLAHYRDAFRDTALRKALWNTLVLAFWVGIASIAVGAPLAWLTARTDVPAKGLIRGLVLASFVTPPFLGAFAWVMLAGPNAGALNTFWRWITGSDTPLLNIFTMPGLVFVVTSYTFPYVYIMLANTLALIASDLEDAAAIHGAGRLSVALTITMPLVAPAIVSGFILAVLQALALFGSPAILALPAGFHTITTQVWSFFQFPPKVELAAAVSVPLLLATALLLLLQKHLLGRRGYASVGGKGGSRRTIALGLWRYPALAGVFVVMACAIFLPYAILAKAAFTKEMPVGYAQSDATFRGIPPDLEEAGRILGAGRLRILYDVTAPLARSGIIAAWCFIFIGVIRELSASIILFTPNTKVMSVVIFDLKEEGQFGAIAVLGLIMLVLTFATVSIVQAVLGRDVLGVKD